MCIYISTGFGFQAFDQTSSPKITIITTALWTFAGPFLELLHKLNFQNLDG